jgi:prefoldin subunit 5
MAALDEAVKRLDRAVARLEKASDGVDADGAAQDEALVHVKADYAALLDTTDSVAARLDAAIARLDRALEG